MFDLNMLRNLLSAAQTTGPAATDAAAKLAELGDPQAIAPLFADAKAWDPKYFGDGFSLGQNPSPEASLGQGSNIFGFADMMNPQRQMPQSVVENFGNVPNPPGPVTPATQIAAQKTPALSKEQMATLMSGMPQGPTSAPPSAGIGRVTPFTAQMAQLQPGQVAAPQRRLTLADLIYGAR